MIATQNIHDVVCPNQLIVFKTSIVSDSTIVTSHTETAQPGLVQYNILVMKRYSYESNIAIVAKSRNVDQENLHFSKLQDLLCHVVFMIS